MDSSTTQTHIPSTEAAAKYGLTNDHIASLCRRHKVEGALVGGRLWFVEERSLAAYLEKTKHAREARHRELSHTMRAQQAVAAPKTEAAPQAQFLPRSFYVPRVALVVAATLFVLVGSSFSGVKPQEPALGAVWESMPAAVAEVSVSAYVATFMRAAKEFYTAIDIAAELQADSYMTLGSIVANSISGIGVLNEMQVSAYESIIAGLEESTTATAHTLAGSVLLADESARELAQWYKDGNERIAQRLSPDQSATVASVPTPLMVAESPAPEVPTIQFITEPEVLGQETERMPQLEVREIYVDVAEGALAADTGERPPVVITVEKDHVSNMNICINESCYYSAAQ